MSRVLDHPILVLLSIFGVFMVTSSAAAQRPRTSLDIQAQIEKSAELQRQALQTLTDPELAERLISSAYAELQAAMSAMVINASGQKLPDPLVNINERRMRQALTHLQAASDTLKVNRSLAPAAHRQEGTPAAESRSYLGVVRNSVEQALSITNSVLVL